MNVQPILLSDSRISAPNNYKNSYNNFNRTFLKTTSCDSVSFTGAKQTATKQIFMLLGAPNSGKGTFASKIASKYSIPQISTGDILRKEVRNNTELGKKAKEYMDSGKLVPDDVIIGMFKERITQKDCQRGFILDGFPRSVEQAKKLDELLSKEKNANLKIINLDIPEKFLYERSARRYFCPECSATPSIENYKEGMKCKCGGELVKRKDDTPEVLTDRLKVYHSQTEPLLGYYGDKVTNFEMKEAFTPVEETFARMCKVIEQ